MGAASAEHAAVPVLASWAEKTRPEETDRGNQGMQQYGMPPEQEALYTLLLFVCVWSDALKAAHKPRGSGCKVQEALSQACGTGTGGGRQGSLESSHSCRRDVHALQHQKWLLGVWSGGAAQPCKDVSSCSGIYDRLCRECSIIHGHSCLSSCL